MASPFTIPSQEKFKENDAGSVLRTIGAKLADVISVKDFGALGDGVTNDTAAIQAAVTAATGKAVYFPAGTYIINSAITVPSNIVISGDGTGSVIQTNTAEVTLFSVGVQTQVVFRNLKLVSSVTSTTAASGGILFNGSDHCMVENCYFVGFSWFGVEINNAQYVNVYRSQFYLFTGSVSDGADVHVRRDSRYCHVVDNWMYGGLWHGILQQDPDGNTVPKNNIYRGNHIGAHTAYGIALYQVGAAETNTLVDGNFIENITGVNPLSGGQSDGGAGVYCVAVGAVRIINNFIRACASATTRDGTLAPGGIGVNGNGLAGPIDIVNNTVVDMSKYHGIYVNASSVFPVTITANTVRVSDSTSQGIYVRDSSRVSVSANTVVSNNTTGSGRCILFLASSIAASDLTATGNVCQASNYSSIEASGASGISDISIVGNAMNGMTNNAIRLDGVTRAMVTGNTVDGTSCAGDYAVKINASTDVRVAANTVKGVGPFGQLTVTGANTRVAITLDNDFNGGGTIDLTGTGATFDRYGTAPPGTGTDAVGSKVINSTALIGAPTGWVCTVAGAPGTFVPFAPAHGSSVNLTGQVANLAAQNVYAAAPAGEYRVSVCARTTTSGTGTTATLNIIWTDEGGVKTHLIGTWALNSVTITGQLNASEYIHAAAASNIQVSVTAGTYGTSVYALSATAERLN